MEMAAEDTARWQLRCDDGGSGDMKHSNQPGESTMENSERHRRHHKETCTRREQVERKRDWKSTNIVRSN